MDEWPQYLRKRKEIFIAIVCFISYLIGLSNVTQGGIYIFNIFNTYACSGWALLTLMFFECIAVSWFYGIDNFYDDIKSMIGYYPSRFWKICWLYLTPFLCVSVALYTLVNYERFTLKKYVYPWWGELIGWLMALSSMIVIPLYVIYKPFKTKMPIKQVNKYF